MPKPPSVPAPLVPTRGVSVEVVDRSCRGPVLMLWWGALLWLVVGSGLFLVSSMKFHAPGFLADSAWSTYGRLQPAAVNAFLYGFGIPAGLGVALWLIARLGNARVIAPGTILAGAGLWPLGVLIGIIEILAGNATGYPWLEMPRSASTVLFLAYALIGIPALMTFARREGRALYPSHWFLLAALFWFPWVYSTANVLLVWWPVRGAMQAVVGWWFQGQLRTVWFGGVGLATLLYLVPKLAQRPLRGFYHLMIAFWIWLIFSGWGDLPQAAPVPSWMPAVATVFASTTLVALLALGSSWHGTLSGHYRQARSDGVFGLTLFAAGAFLVSGVLGILRAWPGFADRVAFTFFEPGFVRLYLYGFYAVALFAAFYVMVPHLIKGGLPFRRLVRIHLVCAVGGVLLQALPLMGGGMAQGGALAQPDIAFVQTLRPGLMGLRLSTLGDLLVLVGHLALLINLTSAIVRAVGSVGWPVLAAALRPEPLEVGR